MKKRRRIRRVQVGGINYDIKYVKSITRNRKSKTEPVGQIDFEHRKIYLLDSLSASEELVYIIHELCHATLEALIPLDVLEANADLEELIVGPFARILAGALDSADIRLH